MIASLILALGLSTSAADKPAAPAQPKHAALCVDGVAEGYPCLNVDLMAHITNAQLGGGSGNDNWGWTDPDT